MSNQLNEFRIGVDIGGTFTDIVAVNQKNGIQFNGKVLTTPKDPSEAVLNGVKNIIEKNKIDPRKCRIIHGTTLVANALIERKGVKTALLTTQGFKDVLEIGREWRYDLFSLDLEMPSPIVPRQLRFEIEERIPLKADSLSNLLYSKNVSALDFIKIDTQGSELEILRGAGDLLRSVIGVEVEVEFVELYKGQPLFQEVNSYISNWGMSLVDLKRTFWKRKSQYQNTRKGQLIYADALYLREPEALLEDNCDEERLIKALVIYSAYGYSDLAISLTMSALSKNIISPESADRFLNSIKKE